MIIKNKIYKSTAIALAVISVFGNNLIYSNAYENINTPQVISQFADGEYELNTTLKHESKDEVSMANSYLKSSSVVIKNGSMYMKLVFKNGDMIKEIIPKVDKNVVNAEEVLNETEKTILFEIKSIDSNIELNVKINPFGDFVVNANCIVNASFVSEPPQVPEETPEVKPEETPDVKPEEKPELKPEDNQSEYKNGFYRFENIVKIDNPTGYAMVRNLLNKNTTMEVRENKYYITFEMSGYSMMKNIQIKVDDKIVNHTQTDLGNDVVRIKIETGSVDSEISMKAFIDAMGKEVEFGIGIDKSSISFVSSNEEPTIPSPPVNNNTNNNNSDGSNNSNENNNSNVGNNIVKGKLYTIKNEVIQDNQTGKEMARKYLNETSKIEEVNGKMYATLTFTGVDLMKNHKIYVNDNVVSHQVISKNSDSISIRFEIPNVDADIKVELLVIPMGKNIDFGVKLLKNTLTFVKEYDAGASGLPQTGSLINTSTMMGMGSLLSVGGMLIGIRKRK